MPQENDRNRVALVTGGTRGIGRAIALALADQGFAVSVGFRSDASAADRLLEDVRSRGGDVIAIRTDLRAAESADELVRKTVDSLGGLDVVVSNAGIMVSAPFLETSVEDVRNQFDVNAASAFRLAQAAAHQMIEQKRGGRLIFVTSRAAHRPVRNLSGYCMSKSALRLLAETLAVELASSNITVNCVAPGTTETDMNRDLLSDPEASKVLLGRILLGRAAKPEDIAAAVVFLASEKASFITGATIAVDGGAAIN